MPKLPRIYVVTTMDTIYNAIKGIFTSKKKAEALVRKVHRESEAADYSVRCEIEVFILDRDVEAWDGRWLWPTLRQPPEELSTESDNTAL